MSAFGDDDPRSDMYDWIKNVQREHDLTPEQIIAATLAALALFADENKDD